MKRSPQGNIKDLLKNPPKKLKVQKQPRELNYINHESDGYNVLEISNFLSATKFDKISQANNSSETLQWVSSEKEEFQTPLHFEGRVINTTSPDSLQLKILEKLNDIIKERFNTILIEKYEDKITTTKTLNDYSGSKTDKLFAVSELEPITTAILCTSGFQLVLKDRTSKNELATIDCLPNGVYILYPPTQQNTLYSIKFTNAIGAKTLWRFREDKIKCSEAFAKLRGRINVRSLSTSIERFYSELCYGCKGSKKYIDIFAEFWDNVESQCASKERVEIGCWCLNKPDTSAKKLAREPEICHAQAIIRFARDRLNKEIPDNLFIVSVRKAELQKRNLTAEGWAAQDNNFYVAFKMQYLPFLDSELRNDYRTKEIKKIKLLPKKGVNK